MKLYLLLILLFLPIIYAETSSSSINWASKVYVDNNFCMIGGDCTINNLNVTGNYTNITYQDINVTSNLDVGGNLTVVGITTSSWFAGLLNYSYIQNWNWTEVFNNMVYLIDQNYYNQTLANNTFQFNISDQECTGTDKFSSYENGIFTCTSDATGTGGSGGGTEGTRFYLFNSMQQDVVWNLTNANPSDYRFYAQENVIITPIGGYVI